MRGPLRSLPPDRDHAAVAAAYDAADKLRGELQRLAFHVEQGALLAPEAADRLNNLAEGLRGALGVVWRLAHQR